MIILKAKIHQSCIGFLIGLTNVNRSGQYHVLILGTLCLKADESGESTAWRFKNLYWNTNTFSSGKIWNFTSGEKRISSELHSDGTIQQNSFHKTKDLSINMFFTRGKEIREYHIDWKIQQNSFHMQHTHESIYVLHQEGRKQMNIRVLKHQQYPLQMTIVFLKSSILIN